ncbi:MAG: hypothetical protein H6925_01150 [Holosporaceae bacterium]|nr:MAG: hypothetical protein H6925_01150 [Holosporaceae bacterium]
MTGHQTFTTLHTKNSPGRFAAAQKDLGIQDTDIKENISGILGQRLYRKLCHACKKPHPFIYKNKTYQDLAP